MPMNCATNRSETSNKAANEQDAARCMSCEAPSATWPWCKTCCNREGVSVTEMHQLPDMRSHDEVFFERIDDELRAREFNPPCSAITRNQARLLAEKTRLCAEGKPCGVPPELGDDSYCDECPNRTDEESSVVGSKFDAEKPRFDLLFSGMPLAIEEVVRVLTAGAAKYAAHNWQFVERAQERYLAAGMRHEVAIQRGETHDDETGLHHLAHKLCCDLFRLELLLRESAK